MAESAFFNAFRLPEMPVLPFPAISGNRQIPGSVAGFAGYPFRGTGNPANRDATQPGTSTQKTTRKGGRTVKAVSVQFSARSGLMSKTKRVAVNDQGRRIGSTHQRAKHPDATIKRVKELKAEGLGYRRIAAQLAVEGTPMPWLTVRDVLKGRIRAQQPCESRKPGDPRTPRYDFPEFYWPPCG